MFPLDLGKAPRGHDEPPWKSSIPFPTREVASGMVPSARRRSAGRQAGRRPSGWNAEIRELSFKMYPARPGQGLIPERRLGDSSSLPDTQGDRGARSGLLWSSRQAKVQARVDRQTDKLGRDGQI